MSTIVAVRKGDTAAIASDSLYSQGSLKVPPKCKVNHHKIYRVNDAFVALVGWGALDDVFESLVRSHLDKLDFSNRITIFDTLRTVQGLLEDDYFLNSTEEKDQPVDSNQMDGLAISSEGIFGFSSYRNVNEYANYWAMGSGRDYALGAMHQAYPEASAADEIARAGIEAGSFFDDGSALPVQVETLKLGSAS